jgi:hypothetical protein
MTFILIDFDKVDDLIAEINIIVHVANKKIYTYYYFVVMCIKTECT